MHADRCVQMCTLRAAAVHHESRFLLICQGSTNHRRGADDAPPDVFHVPYVISAGPVRQSLTWCSVTPDTLGMDEFSKVVF